MLPLPTLKHLLLHAAGTHPEMVSLNQSLEPTKQIFELRLAVLALQKDKAKAVCMYLIIIN